MDISFESIFWDAFRLDHARLLRERGFRMALGKGYWDLQSDIQRFAFIFMIRASAQEFAFGIMLSEKEFFFSVVEKG